MICMKTIKEMKSEDKRMRSLCAILAGMITNKIFELVGIDLFSLKGTILGIIIAGAYAIIMSFIF